MLKPFIFLFSTLTIMAQSASKPEFEVASIRRSSPDALLDSFVPTLNIAPGATLRLANRRLAEIVMIAYNVGGKQLEGPKWLVNPGGAMASLPRFDIVAKVPQNAEPEQVPLMLQNLLADRFKMRVHTEQRQIMIYALEAQKSGLTVQPVPKGAGAPSGCTRNLFGDDGITHAQCQNMTPAQLAQQLQTLSPAYFSEGPIVDQTKLTEKYDFALAWITQQQRAEGAEGPSMLEAIDKLGLHIDHRKGNADILVVDQMEEMPTDN